MKCRSRQGLWGGAGGQDDQAGQAEFRAAGETQQSRCWNRRMPRSAFLEDSSGRRLRRMRSRRTIRNLRGAISWPIRRRRGSRCRTRKDAKDRTVYFATNRAQSAAGIRRQPHFTADISDQLTVGQMRGEYSGAASAGQFGAAKLVGPGRSGEAFSGGKRADHAAARTVSGGDGGGFVVVRAWVQYGFRFRGAAGGAVEIRFAVSGGGDGAVLAVGGVGGQVSAGSPAGGAKRRAGGGRAGRVDRGDGKSAPGSSRPKLHILAHSMGNHLLLRAIARLAERGCCRKTASCLGRSCWRRPTWGRWSSTIYCRLCWSIRSA